MYFLHFSIFRYTAAVSFSLLFFFLSFPATFLLSQSALFNPDLGESPSQIMINNRILAKVNDKAISVVDVMKKMDMIFYKQFPEYASSKAARYQFYQTNWRHILQDLIDKELILADAEENKFAVSNGEVRQEMEEVFGPQIISNLDRAGLTYDEAWKMIQSDIIIRRMLFLRVHAKAMKKVVPQDVRNAYESYSKEHIKPDEWIYRVISIRDPDQTKGAQVAEKIYQTLSEKKLSFDDLQLSFKNLSEDTTTVNLSEEFHHTDKDISPAYLDILLTLQANSFSKPIAQKSRADFSTVYRLFYLLDRKAGGVVPFEEVAEKLKDSLIGELVDKETTAYFKKLRKHFAVHQEQLKEMLPEDFQPFLMK